MPRSAQELAPYFSPSTAHVRALRRETDRFIQESLKRGSLLGDAARSEWLYPWARRSFVADDAFELDLSYNFEVENYDELFEGIDTAYLPEFRRAKSHEHALWIRNEFVRLTQIRQRLAMRGTAGIVGQFAANILDPVAISADLLTAGTSRAFLVGGRAGRLSRLWRMGVIGAGTEMSLETMRAGLDPYVDAESILYAGAGAFVLGGGMHALFGRGGNSIRDAHRAMRRQIELNDALTGGRKLTKKGENYWWRELSEQEKWWRIRRLTDGLDLDDDLKRQLIGNPGDELSFSLQPEPGVPGGRPFWRELPFGEQLLMVERLAARFDAAPATRSRWAQMDPSDVLDEMADLGKVGPGRLRPADPPAPRQPEMKIGDLDYTDHVDPQGVTMGGIRWLNIGARIKHKLRSLHGRRLADLAGEDPFPDGAGRPATYSTTEWIGSRMKLIVADFYRHAIPSFKSWAEARGLNSVNRALHEVDFFNEVGRALRRPIGQYPADAGVHELANYLRDQFKEMLLLGQRHGVPGLENIKSFDTYLMRLYSKQAISEAIRLHHSDTVIALFSKAIQQGSGDVKPERARALAIALLKHVQSGEWNPDVNKINLFTYGQIDTIERVLREAVGDDVSAEVVEEIIGELRPARTLEEGAIIPRARARYHFDETATVDILDGRGNVTGTLGIEDLLENNAAALYNSYSRQILGASAWEQVGRAFSRDLDQPVRSFAGMMGVIAREAGGENAIPRAYKSGLEMLYRSTIGLRLDGNSAWNTPLKHLRALQYIRVMNKVGIAQIPEMGNILAGEGWFTMLQQMPALRRLYSRARNMEMNDETLREIEVWWAAGTDRLRDQALVRAESLGTPDELAHGRLQRIEHAGMKLTNDISGMAPINMALQRMAMLSANQRWANYAARFKKTGKIPGRLSQKRLGAMGLTEADAEQVLRQMAEHVEWTRGELGGRYRLLHMDKWDQNVASKFLFAQDKWARRAIQENSVGMLRPWMTSGAGRTIIQFRTFIMGAYEKQFLFSFWTRDWEAASAMMYTTFLGGMAYMAQMQMQSVGRRDRREFLEERFTPARIGAAAFQRTGWATFMPAIIDSGVYGMGFESMPFSYGRSSGLETNPIAGNPTADFIESLPRFTRAVLGPLRGDYEFSEQDLQAIMRLTPYQNAVGWENFIRIVGGRLPRASR